MPDDFPETETTQHEAANAAFDEAQQACRDGNYEKAREIINTLSDGDVDTLLGITEELQDGNPDEEIAEAIEVLEPAAGEVAEAALDAGRPDLAADVVIQTLESLADMAEAEEELAETLTDVAEEIGDPAAEAIASDAAEAAGEAAAEVTELLEEAGVPAEIAEETVDPDPANGTEVFAEDVAPEPSHWLLRQRFGRSRV